MQEESSVKKYLQFIQENLNIDVEKPSMLLIVALLTLFNLLSTKKIRTAVIDKKAFLDHKDIVDQILEELNFKSARFNPVILFDMLEGQPFAWKIGNKIRLDDNLHELLSKPGDRHTDIYFHLINSAKELLETNDPMVYEGMPQTINFEELEDYEDNSLRDYQIENKRNIYKLWCNNRSVMLQMPTGTGKTRLFVSVVNDIQNWAEKHFRRINILLLAHRKELISQISHNVGVTYKIPHGLIFGPNEENFNYSVQIGSVQTLINRIDRWESMKFDVIIIDEAHHVKADSYVNIISTFPNAKVLGVTATPYRLNGVGFHPEFEELIISPSVSTFIKNGYLCDYDYYSIKPDSTLNKQIASIEKFALDGDYLDSSLMEIMDTQTIRANIVNTYLKYAAGLKGIVYTINKAHNSHVCERFLNAGVRAAAIDSSTPSKLRDEIVEKFKKGKIDVLCNVNIFSEGFDCPDVEFIQLARPTKSLSMFLQQVGRGLRISQGKEKVIFLDNVGLYNRFGLPSARRHWKYHFEGHYKNDEENPFYEFSVEGTEEKEVIPIDEKIFEEGDENVSLLHSSRYEDPTQIDEYGYIKNFDGYIRNQLSKARSANGKLRILQKQLKDLQEEEKVFRKYRIIIPEDVENRIRKLEFDIDKILKEETLIEKLENYSWGKLLSKQPSPYNSKTIEGIMKVIDKAGYSIHVVVDKDNHVSVKFSQKNNIL